MYGSRIQALTRQKRAETSFQPAPEMRRVARRASLTGPVHRMGPAWHDAALLESHDPGAELLAPATDFYRRMRRTARAAVFLSASISMTPALPLLFGLA